MQLRPFRVSTLATSDSLEINYSYTSEFLRKFFVSWQAYYVIVITKICRMESPT